MPTTSDPAIEVRGLSKDYNLGQLADVITLTARRVRRDGSAKEGPGVLHALKDLNFRVDVGDCLGIMGSNGSGKSTLIQIISAITVPTAGVARVRGRVLPLVEVGSVFHEELTARENVELFGTVLGLTRDEIRDATPEIAEFGGFSDWHMDTPLKRHSTGMHARLGFAVALRFPADIYIFDEVMAVVDDQFRARATEEIQALVASGRTVVFISHDLDLVRTLCTKGMWLEKGELRAFGEIDPVADQYAAAQAAGAVPVPPPAPETIAVTSWGSEGD